MIFVNLIKAIISNIEARVYFFAAGLCLSVLGLLWPNGFLDVMKNWDKE